MDLTGKNLIKLLAHIEVYPSDKFILKPHFHKSSSSLYCFEILVTNKSAFSKNFACNFFFDCNSSKIYLEDYGTIFSSQVDLDDTMQELFQEALQLLNSFLSNFPDLKFRLFQTTSRIPEKFNFLKKMGFEQKEQLNHYENFKFIKQIS